MSKTKNLKTKSTNPKPFEPQTGIEGLDFLHEAIHMTLDDPDGEQVLFRTDEDEGRVVAVAQIPQHVDGKFVGYLTVRFDLNYDVLLTIQAAAAYANRTRRTIESWLNTGKLPHVRGIVKGYGTMIARQDLIDYMAERGFRV